MSRAAPAYKPDLTGLQLAQLARLAEIGMEIAEAAGLQARGVGEGQTVGADPALSFSRAARAVRLTIALQARLVADRAAAERAQGAVRAAEAAGRRRRIHDKVEALIDRVAEAEDGGAEAAEHLSSAAWERLVETDDADLLDLPIEEIVARICADLGVPPAWAASAFGPAAAAQSGERPLSHPADDSSPVNGGAGEGATPFLLPCPAEDGGGGPQGRRGRATVARPPPLSG